jgi:hypothetical protein
MTNTSAVPEAGPAQAVSPRGRFFANQTFHFETLRNAGYIVSNCADLGEILETVKVIAEGDVQSWYTAWEGTADRVLALAERTRDPLSKGGAYMRASTYQRTAEFLIPPDDPKRPESFQKTGSYFFKALDTLGVRYERIWAAKESNCRVISYDVMIRSTCLPKSTSRASAKSTKSPPQGPSG